MHRTSCTSDKRCIGGDCIDLLCSFSFGGQRGNSTSIDQLIPHDLAIGSLFSLYYNTASLADKIIISGGACERDLGCVSGSSTIEI